ncbi:NRDE family protein [Halomonas llamarensis]|uniref:NRDE family protein n=1 Tax=Halomonas llamarensis TaxID=2945104 RepID=A0ABT0SPJ5_9GAMM|nr:NRDE family protein [Halomonas llamarensis]MCL7929742.1 NRDE family protein [Halomonas llamarensis]
MCLLAFDWQPGAPTPLRLIGNRDEFYVRPTAGLHDWDDAPILGGRDLEAGGTWLAVNRQGVLATLTNVRDPALVAPPGTPSRGELVVQALTCEDLPTWLEQLTESAPRYAGFNLLVATPTQMWHLHRGRERTALREVPRGIHTLSNADLNTPWPKTVKLHQAMVRDTTPPITWPEASRHVIQQTDEAPAQALPDTGVGLTLEQRLSAAFIVGETYGTRATTWVTLDRQGNTAMTEQRFGQNGQFQGETALFDGQHVFSEAQR